MNIYAKAAIIISLLILSLLAGVVDWKPRHQKQQLDNHKKSQKVVQWTDEDEPNILQEAWQMDSANKGRRRYQRNIVVEFEPNTIEVSDTTSRKNDAKVNPTSNKQQYSIINSGKNKATFTESQNRNREMVEMIEGSGSGFETTESPTDTTTVIFTEISTPEGSEELDTLSTATYTTEESSEETETVTITSPDISFPTSSPDISSSPISPDISSSSSSPDISYSSISPDISSPVTSTNIFSPTTSTDISSSPVSDISTPTTSTDISSSPVSSDISTPTTSTDISFSSISSDIPSPATSKDISSHVTSTNIPSPTNLPDISSSSIKPDISSSSISSDVPSPATSTDIVSSSISSSTASTATSTVISSPAISTDISSPTTNTIVSYPSTSPDTSSSASPTNVVSSTTTTTTTSPTTSVTTPSTATGFTETTPNCQNGGTYDGVKCVCQTNFYGPFCETAIEIIDLGASTVNTTMEVEIRITNQIYTEEMNDHNSDDFKEFERLFKLQMSMVYSAIPGFTDVIIIELLNGSVIAIHEVIVLADYNKDENVTEQYIKALEKLKEALAGLSDCSDPSDPSDPSLICIDPDDITVKSNIPKTKEEICEEIAPPGFEEHYSPVVADGSLLCVSSCSPLSNTFLNCNDGNCHIQNNTRAQCLCPHTDIYLYSSPGCRGKMLKAGLYGGVGAAVAVLSLVIAGGGFFMFKKFKRMKKAEPDIAEESLWYEAEDSEWGAERGFTNLSRTADDDVDGFSGNGSGSGTEKFQPNLENVDTSIEVKIQRPVISTA